MQIPTAPSHRRSQVLTLTSALLVAAAASSGCAALGLGDSTGMRAPNPRVLRLQVDVSEHTTTDTWEVRWTSSRPVAALRFRRTASAGREASWQLRAGPVAWARQGPAELLRSTQGPLLPATVSFATDTRPIPGDRELNVAGSDGSRLLYTGLLDVEPLVCPSPSDTRCAVEDLRPWDGPVQRHWTLSTAPGRVVHVAGDTGAGSLDWHQEGSSAVGTYAYFGPQAPVISAEGTLIIDPGLPRWMRDDVVAAGPELLAWFASATGISLPHPPTILVSWTATEGARAGLSGAALAHDTLQLVATGAAWAAQTPARRLEWRRFVAGKAFQLWQGGEREVVFGPSDDWLVEGGADYLALRALVATDLIEVSLADRLVLQDANRCLLALEGEPLATATRTGRRGAVSPCGSVLHAIADRAVRRANDGRADIRHVYRELWLNPADDRVRTSTYSFMAALHALTLDPTAPAPISRLVQEGLPLSADAWMQAELLEAGFAVELVGPRLADVEPAEFLRPLARILTRCDCSNRPQPATVAESVLAVRPSADCNLFRQGYRLAEVESFPPGDQPLEAWLAVTDAIGSHRRVEISAEPGGPIAKLQCGPAAADGSWTRLLRASP